MMASKVNIFDQLDKNQQRKANVFDTLRPPLPVSVEPQIQQMNPMDLADLEAGGIDPTTMDLGTNDFDADDVSLSIPKEDLPYREQQRIRNAERKIDREQQADQFAKDAPVDLENIGDHLWENKFAYTLGVLGLVGGHWGSMVGGSLGTAFDTAIKTKEATGEVEEGEVMFDASVSAIIDAGTRGATKVIPGLKKAITDGLRRGIDPDAIVKALRKDTAENFGTSASTKQAQETISTETYSSLTMGQAKDEALNQFQRIMNNLSKEGILSSDVHKRNSTEILNVAKQAINKIAATGGKKITALQVGKNVSTILNYGKGQLTTHHGKILEELAKGGNMNNTVSAKPFKNSLKQWEKLNGLDKKGSDKLTPQARKILDDLKNEWAEVGSFPAKHYLEITQKLNKQINQFKTFGSRSFDPTAAREITSLSTELKNLANKELLQINREVGQKFIKANKTYATSMQNMFPDITADYIKGTGKNGYAQIADMFDAADSVEKILSVQKSIREAYKQLPNDIKKRLPAKNADQAFNLIKQRYVERTLTTLQDRAISGEEVTTLATKLAQADGSQIAKQILGKDFNVFKRLVNLMAESSRSTAGGIGGLSLRTQELGSSIAVGGAAVAATVSLSALASLPATVITALGVLSAPKMMAKYVTNPKRVNKLLQISKHARNPYKAPDLMKQQVLNLYNDVYKEFDDDEKKELFLWIKEKRKSMLGLNN